jgi:ribose/xylose/arabinose/galactoside ABC-type transport system permease subunit
MAKTEERQESAADTAKRIAQHILGHENALLAIVLIALVAGVSVITGGKTTTRVNMLNILTQSSIRGVASIGQAFVILTAGIDVSVGGIGLMVTILGAAVMTLAPDLSIVSHPFPIYAGIAIMLLAGAGFGAINGLSVSRIGMPPLIVTLAMWQISQGIGFQICGGWPLYDLPQGMLFFGEGSVAGVPVPVIIAATVTAIGYFTLNHTIFGRSVYAVGGNPVSAWLTGINVKKILFVVYIISGFLAGLTAIIFIGRTMAASMNSCSGLELDSIAACTVGGLSLSGGKGTIIGVVLGVIVIGVVNNALSILSAGPAVQALVKGAIIFGAVAVDVVRRR